MAALVDVEEWRRWRRSRRGGQRWEAWADRHPVLRGWDVDELTSPRWSERTDRMQAALVDLAQAGEDRAALTLLVQLRPGLLRVLRWATVRGLVEAAEADDEVRSVFTETLYRHRLDRRPARIAANLVLDTRQRIHRTRRPPAMVPLTLIEGGRSAGPGGGVGSGGRPDGPDDPAGGLAVADEVRRVIAGLPGTDRSRAVTAEVAVRAWILDQPHAEIADDLGLGRPAVAARLHRVRRAMRDQAAA